MCIPSGGHARACASVPILGTQLLILDMFIHYSLKCFFFKNKLFILESF